MKGAAYGEGRYSKKGVKTGRVCQRGYKEVDSGVFVGMKILSRNLPFIKL